MWPVRLLAIDETRIRLAIICCLNLTCRRHTQQWLAVRQKSTVPASQQFLVNADNGFGYPTYEAQLPLTSL